MHRQPATYILASRRNRTLYIGVTGDLVRRIWQHREHLLPGFTNRHAITRVVWYELHATMEAAIIREKRLKRWNRAWKIRLVEQADPYWNDLWPHLAAGAGDTGSPPARG